MEKAWLESRLAEGRSISAIAEEAGRPPSTVSYWVNKHGLASALALRHAPRGGVASDTLEALVGEGLTTQQIAERLGLGATTVRYWLRKHRLKTVRARESRAGEEGQPVVTRRCRRHGYTAFVTAGVAGHFRCRLCRAEHVSRRRRMLKHLLVREAGGHCLVCGYGRYPGALHFHHVDPATKSFGLGGQGVTRSLASAREEARKCVLLCANCHAEVEGGIATIPLEAVDDREAGRLIGRG